jgi:hypothetical protein
VTLPEADRAELTRLENALWREDTRFDLALQEQVFAPDCLEFGRSGRVYTREQMLVTERARIDAVLPLPDLAIRLLDENTAQVTYNSRVTYGGVVEHARRSSLWSRTAAGWVLRFHQGTPYFP